MKKLFLLLVTIGLLTGLISACTALPQAPAPGFGDSYNVGISANGSGKVYLTPNLAYITLGVRSTADKVSDALAENNTLSQAIVQKLTEMGVESKDVQTTAFNVYPEQVYDMEGNVTGTRYNVENSVAVTVRDLTILGKMLDGVVGAGANSINSITFDVADKETALSEARKLAVADAQNQAREIAEAAGVKLGKIINVNVYANNYGGAIYEGKGGAGFTNDHAVPVSAGQLVIQVDASITYEISQ